MSIVNRMVIICLLASGAASLRAANYYAARNGQPPGGDCSTWEKASSNIQDAVNAATTNDTVWVGAGRYPVPPNATNYGGTNVVFINKPLILRSSNSVPATTIIDGGGTNRGIAMRYSSSSASNLLIIDGFTVCNCFATNTGGGIMLDPQTKWTNIIRNCIISNNTVAWGYDFSSFGGGAPGYASRGGGIGVHVWVQPFMLIVSNCTIIGNQALNGPGGSDRSYGGGISRGYASTDSGIVIDNCLIQSNSAYYGAGYGDRAGVPSIRNCVFRDNTGTTGGGIYWMSYTDWVRNCLIYGNKANSGGGIFISNGFYCHIENCTIVSNTATYAGGGGGIWVNCLDLNAKLWLQNSIVISNVGSGNVNLFYNYAAPNSFSNIWVSNTCLICSLELPGSTNIIADSPSFINFAGQNYRLANNSPCINRGFNQAWTTNGVDLDRNTRIRYGTVDMGAYELINDGTIYKFH